ncbi:hypothetical protein Acsp06_63800 [Actinomycetospora sp. NBRC 106375]|uniref:hypothetical protein n=1 Tax=Actinomycetospora sp. NBRC 106375 TaxID=3032207 RepID=UPI0024A57D95|nr:hypothetical protein [Actinomycetospora sp. NBRC 106375]GLZ50195.1 hypothetical protein Acsp06_63800 [Actinomycetospora sp. NBRC 106375]
MTGRVITTDTGLVSSVAHRDRTSCEVTLVPRPAVYWVSNPAVLDVLVLGLVRQWDVTVEIDMVSLEVVGARVTTGHDSTTTPSEGER